MHPILRSILAVVVGAASSVLVVTMGDALVARLFPLPGGVDTRDAASMASAIAAMPMTALLLLLLGWVMAAVVGSYLAARFAPRAPRAHGLLVALLVLAATIINLTSIQHPGWMLPAAVILIPLMGLVGADTAPQRLPSR